MTAILCHSVALLSLIFTFTDEVMFLSWFVVDWSSVSRIAWKVMDDFS